MGFSGVNLGNIGQASADPSAAQMQQAQQAVQTPPQQQQPAPQPQQQGQPQQPGQESDPIRQQLLAKVQESQQAKFGVKQVLQDFFAGMSRGMVPFARTPVVQQHDALANLNSYDSSQATAQYHRTLSNLSQLSPYQLPDGSTIQVAAKDVPHLEETKMRNAMMERMNLTQVSQEAAQANPQLQPYVGQMVSKPMMDYLGKQLQAGPTVNTTDAMQQMGMPAQTSLKSANTAQGIISKQQANTPVDDELRSLIPNLPASATSVPTASLMRFLATTTPATRTGYEWKDINGVLTPLPTKSVTTRGRVGAGSAAAPGGGSAPSAGLPAPIATSIPGYAFNPQTNETQLTTPQEAQQKGMTNFRKVSSPNIEADRQLNNRLADVAMKVSQYNDSLNTPVDAADRTFMASLLQTDKFKVALGGMELPVDKFNELSDAITQSQLSKPAQNRLLAYLNAKESMLGYQRVLAGSAQSSDARMHLNLAALPGPVSPDDFAKEGIRQFTPNILRAGSGLPRLPGVQTAGDILAPKISFKEGNDTYNIPASRVADFKAKHPQAVPSAR